MFDLLDVATCDGYSLCKALSEFRCKASNGQINHWYSNCSEACQKALVKEIGKLCYLAGLMPTSDEYQKGVRTYQGEEVSSKGPRVVLRPRSHEDVNCGPSGDGQGEEPPADDIPMDREEANSAEGGGSTSAEGPPGYDSGGGSTLAGRTREVLDEFKVLDVDYIVREKLDPVQGAPRPYGIKKGCYLFNDHKMLAVGWTSPSHIPGGKAGSEV